MCFHFWKQDQSRRRSWRTFWWRFRKLVNLVEFWKTSQTKRVSVDLSWFRGLRSVVMQIWSTSVSFVVNSMKFSYGSSSECMEISPSVDVCKAQCFRLSAIRCMLHAERMAMSLNNRNQSGNENTFLSFKFCCLSLTIGKVIENSFQIACHIPNCYTLLSFYIILAISCFVSGLTFTTLTKSFQMRWKAFRLQTRRHMVSG